MPSPVYVHIANGQVSRYVLFMAMLYFMKVFNIPSFAQYFPDEELL